MSTFEVVLRAIASLIVVVGLIVWLGKRFNADGSGAMLANLTGPAARTSKGVKRPRLSMIGNMFAGASKKQENLIKVVSRQGLVGRTAITVVDVDGQRLVLGVTDTNVSVLHSRELAAESLDADTYESHAATNQGSGKAPFAVVLDDALDSAGKTSHDAASGAKPSGVTAVRNDAAGTPEHVATRLREQGGVEETEALDSVVSLSSRMDGSILSPNTWRQAKAAMKVARVGGTQTTNDLNHWR